MATKVFVVLSSGDREVALEVGLIYPLNAAKNVWMDEVKVILFGPSEKVAAYDAEVQGRIGELLENEVEVLACKWCADRMGITEKLEGIGVQVEYVGSIISDLLKEGWASLTF
jgi:hypothetical protein